MAVIQQKLSVKQQFASCPWDAALSLHQSVVHRPTPLHGIYWTLLITSGL